MWSSSGLPSLAKPCTRHGLNGGLSELTLMWLDSRHLDVFPPVSFLVIERLLSSYPVMGSGDSRGNKGPMIPAQNFGIGLPLWSSPWNGLCTITSLSHSCSWVLSIPAFTHKDGACCRTSSHIHKCSQRILTRVPIPLSLSFGLAPGRQVFLLEK